MKYASFDLHLHTYWSYDALAAPEEYFARAQELNLKAFSITDHHNFDSFEEYPNLSEKYPGAHIILGAEMSAQTPAGILDIVCLGFNPNLHGDWQKLLDDSRARQVQWGTRISAECMRRGYPFTDADREALLRSYRPAHVVDVQGRTHVRSTNVIPHLEKMGVSRKEFYEIVGLAMPDSAFLDARDVVNAVHSAGGIAIWAHPYDYNKQQNEHWLDMLCEYAPVDGLECAHTDIPADMTPFYRNYCLKHNLLSSAGSDCHVFPLGSPTTQEVMAVHIGDDRWLDEILERISIWK